MRVQLRSTAFAILGSVGILAQQGAAFAGDGESSSNVRGSLGASLNELSLDDIGGVLVFALNAGFALAFLIAAWMMSRKSSHSSGSPHADYSGVSHVKLTVG